MVVIYTDALTEASDPAGQMLGERGATGGRASWTRGIASGSVRPSSTASPATAPVDDNATVLVLHHNAGPTSRMSVGQKLDVYAKAFGLKMV